MPHTLTGGCDTYTVPNQIGWFLPDGLHVRAEMADT